MRFAMLVAAFSAACLAVPAQAAVHLYQYEVTATVTGSQSVYAPNQVGCNGGPPGSIFCTAPGPYTETFTSLSASLVNETGTGVFSNGGCHTTGCYSGTIIGGFEQNGSPNFSGVDFSFSFDHAFDFKFGSAPTFAVRLVSIDGVPAVPEPATWAMLMLGFGGIGAALRRRVLGPSLRVAVVE